MLSSKMAIFSNEKSAKELTQSWQICHCQSEDEDEKIESRRKSS